MTMAGKFAGKEAKRREGKGKMPGSFPVPTYLFFKGYERLGKNDVKVAGQAGKGERKVGSSPIFVRPSLDAMRSSQNRLRSDWNESGKKARCNLIPRVFSFSNMAAYEGLTKRRVFISR